MCAESEGGWREEGETYQVPCLSDKTNHTVGSTFKWRGPSYPVDYTRGVHHMPAFTNFYKAVTNSFFILLDQCK